MIIHSHSLGRITIASPTFMATKKKKNADLVFIPIPGIGHIVSMTEFAKCLLARDDRLSITILVISPPSTPQKPASAASDTPIRYINIPPVDPPPFSNSPEKFISDYIESHKPLIEHAIKTEILSDESVEFAGIVLDLFCTSMIDVANWFKVPSYLFFASGAAFLGFMLHLPVRHNQVAAEFCLSEANSDVSTYANSVPSNVLPSVVFDKEGYKSYLYHGTRFKETKGFIINTFSELEPYAINSLMMTPPPVYAVGPLLKVKEKSRGGSGSGWDEVMTWLDDQPPMSVVFLCFGSEGGFHRLQLDQIAMALESSGTRFLWSIRRPPPKGSHEMPTDYKNIKEALPEGFMGRIGKRGMVCGWAHQMEVLAHPAIGGFVSHCGWNSILESVWYGVPVATWPMYAEQQTNAFQLVRELGMAVEFTLDYRLDSGELVMADVIEKAINCLMDDENPVRKKVKKMSEKSRKAVMEGGSSYNSLGQLIRDILGNIHENDA